jgi:hypothetical protein
VAEVRFLLRFVASDAELVHVGDDDEIAGRHVRRERGFMFAAQTERDLARQTAEHLIGGVNQDPILLDVTRFSGVRFHFVDSFGVVREAVVSRMKPVANPIKTTGTRDVSKLDSVQNTKPSRRL